MERVSGIGGFFFRAQDPAALAVWYDQHLGVSPVPRDAGEEPWQQSAGPTSFAPFPEKSDYFRNPEKVWMLNFRVRDLDAMVAQLREAGIAVVVSPAQYSNGKSARLTDPEGNPIELWQPAHPNGV